MSGVSGDISSLWRLNKKLAQLPKRVAQEVASHAAKTLTALAQGVYGKTGVYGDPIVSVNGEPLTLVREGNVKNDLSFVAIGTLVRARLNQKYAKYLIGKYKILPIGDATKMPVQWTKALEHETKLAIEQETKRLADA